MKKINFNSKLLRPFKKIYALILVVLVALKNIYLLILLVFVVWMIFFDSNSWFIHNELNSDIDDLKTEKNYYQKEIEKDKKALKELSTDEGLEKFARESYYMKRENEDLFIIEYEDSLKTNTND